MTITLTENAGRFIHQQLAKMKQGVMFRVGIKKSGCSGNSYIFDYAENIDSNDHLFEFQDIKLSLLQMLCLFCKGLKLTL